MKLTPGAVKLRIQLALFQSCLHGQCLPFYPNGSTSPDTNLGNKTVVFTNTNSIDFYFLDKERPAWYDPVFTKVFSDLRLKYDFELFYRSKTWYLYLCIWP